MKWSFLAKENNHIPTTCYHDVYKNKKRSWGQGWLKKHFVMPCSFLFICISAQRDKMNLQNLLLVSFISLSLNIKLQKNIFIETFESNIKHLWQQIIMIKIKMYRLQT